MVLNAPESSDPISKNALVVPAGSFAFLKIALREGSNGPLVPLDSDWATVGTSIVSILDPDGAPLTWETNELDVGDVTDDYDENRSSYVGDQITPELEGLHATLSGGYPVRLALKIKVPSGAEQTSGNSSRSYTVNWLLKKNGNVVPASESFNIGPSGIPVFSDISVTAEEVLCGVSTALDTPTVECLIAEAGQFVTMELTLCGIAEDTTDTLILRAVRQATLLYTRHLIAFYDASAGNSLKSIKEGAEQIVFAGSDSSTSIHSLYDKAMRTLEHACRRAPGRRASFGVIGKGGCC